MAQRHTREWWMELEAATKKHKEAIIMESRYTICVLRAGPFRWYASIENDYAGRKWEYTSEGMTAGEACQNVVDRFPGAHAAAMARIEMGDSL